MVYIVMAYIVMAYLVLTYIVMACIVMAHTLMAHTVMAHTVMAHTLTCQHRCRHMYVDTGGQYDACAVGSPRKRRAVAFTSRACVVALRIDMCAGMFRRSKALGRHPISSKVPIFQPPHSLTFELLPPKTRTSKKKALVEPVLNRHQARRCPCAGHAVGDAGMRRACRCALHGHQALQAVHRRPP